MPISAEVMADRIRAIAAVQRAKYDLFGDPLKIRPLSLDVLEKAARKPDRKSYMFLVHDLVEEFQGYPDDHVKQIVELAIKNDRVDLSFLTFADCQSS